MILQTLVRSLFVHDYLKILHYNSDTLNEIHILRQLSLHTTTVDLRHPSLEPLQQILRYNSDMLNHMHILSRLSVRTTIRTS